MHQRYQELSVRLMCLFSLGDKRRKQGLELLKTALKVAEKGGLALNWKKCVFFERRVEFFRVHCLQRSS